MLSSLKSHGSSWTRRDLQSGTPELRGLTYANSTFVAVGRSGAILTSSDGTSWTSRTSGTSETLRAITYVNRTFMVVGESGTVLISSDGITWSVKTTGTSNNLYGVSYIE